MVLGNEKIAFYNMKGTNKSHLIHLSFITGLQLHYNITDISPSEKQFFKAELNNALTAFCIAKHGKDLNQGFCLNKN